MIMKKVLCDILTSLKFDVIHICKNESKSE